MRATAAITATMMPSPIPAPKDSTISMRIARFMGCPRHSILRERGRHQDRLSVANSINRLLRNSPATEHLAPPFLRLCFTWVRADPSGQVHGARWNGVAVTVGSLSSPDHAPAGAAHPPRIRLKGRPRSTFRLGCDRLSLLHAVEAHVPALQCEPFHRFIRNTVSDV
jgi:hypothetical protein